MKQLWAGNRLPASFLFVLCSLQISTIAHAETIENEDFIAHRRMVLDIAKPGYLNIAHNPLTGQPELLVSSFRMFGKDSLFSLSNWHKGLRSPDLLNTTTLTDTVTWPNEARSVAKEVFQDDGILISGGFLVPGKATGAVTFMPWSQPEQTHPITTPRKGWFYHRTEEWDVNGDGHLDIITARAYKPVMGKHDGELLWLENPGSGNALTLPWKEHIIGRGPDVHFRILPASKASPLTIIATEFSAKKLSAYRLNANNTFDYTVLDQTLGSAFDVQLEDLNRDGNIDLLVTNHEADAKASVFAYELDPESLRVRTRHVLLTGIETRQKAIKSASPGPISTFFPATADGKRPNKPWILVSGDGSQRAHILVPTDDTDSKTWNYREHILWNPTSTVGQSAFADIDGDGQIEIFVPAYDADQVAVFTLSSKH